MFDFLPSTEPDESDPTADDQLAETVEASASTIPAAETPAVVSDVAEGTPTDTESPADLASDESEASADLDEADPPDGAPEKKAPTAVSKTATGEKEVIDLVDQVDLPDFSHEPTEPGQYTLRIVFTFRPGNQSVLLSTQSHDVLAIVGELDPEGARVLLAPFIAAHDARLSDIKQALTKSPAKAPARSNTAKKAPPASSTSSTSTKTPAAKKDKPTKVVKPASPAPLPQTNLFND